MSGGVLLVVAGVWVLAQTLGGNALRRLTILPEPDQQTDAKAGSGGVPTNPLNPLTPRSPLNPLNPTSPLNPLNPLNPFSPITASGRPASSSNGVSA